MGAQGCVLSWCRCISPFFPPPADSYSHEMVWTKGHNDPDPLALGEEKGRGSKAVHNRASAGQGRGGLSGVYRATHQMHIEIEDAQEKTVETIMPDGHVETQIQFKPKKGQSFGDIRPLTAHLQRTCQQV